MVYKPIEHQTEYKTHVRIESQKLMSIHIKSGVLCSVEHGAWQ